MPLALSVSLLVVLVVVLMGVAGYLIDKTAEPGPRDKDSTR